ncbi:MAG TPA: two-component sensor histidine kinase [Microcoleaceae bacterium UBA10368]|jgi:Signal transduction histidine kinase|nr:two-component sensor histidine kinase [Microcoleaceae cyanobacterium UBA10368]HCV32140.1 two-component sensor histidine kinase [Microcoleaceae cyanobacterium UBA9251]
MVKLGQSSFRRILLSRILLLSVPVLLVGEYVTYRKARSMLLETARQNLTESAVRKAETIEQWAKSLKSNLIGASENSLLQSVEPKDYQKLISQLGQRLPAPVDCLQLTHLQTNQVIASTCGPQQIHSQSPPANFWPQQQQQALLDDKSVYISLSWPNMQQGKLNDKNPVSPAAKFSDGSKKGQEGKESPVSLVLSAPVYIRQGNGRQLTYALSLQSALPVQTSAPKGSLAGYTVAIDQDGTILAHPNIDRVGRNIDAEADADRLKSIVKRAIAGGQAAFLHLFSFERNGVELLAGYAAIPSPLTQKENSKWIILAVSRLDYALSGLEEIQQVLFNLIVGLVAASIIATLYLSRDLARPLETLRDYALKVDTEAPQGLPQNLQIKEFNQLAEALNSMVLRLSSWAGELEVATKEAQVANQLKNEFLRNISHELRTPLNGMISFLQLVRDGYCDDRDEEMDFLQQAHDSAMLLLNIINDILDIAKIESGSFSVILEVIDLTEVLEEAVDLQAVPIKEKGLNLSLPALRDPITVYADPEKLKQVFLNVLSNAVKFTESGSISISMNLESRKIKSPDVVNGNVPESTTSGCGESEWVVVTVKDTGIGIDPEQMQKLFQPFVMADGSTTRKFGGNGLGLAISRKIMESMKGSITLHSTGINQGATVVISLPVEQQSHSSVDRQDLLMENAMRCPERSRRVEKL